jgi:hypothetical protein
LCVVFETGPGPYFGIIFLVVFEIIFDYIANNLYSLADIEFLGTGFFTEATLGTFLSIIILEFKAPVGLYVVDYVKFPAHEDIVVIKLHNFRDRDSLGAVIAVSAAGTELIEGFI